MMLHVPRAKSMTNWASICGLRCNQKENRNTHHTPGPTGIDVEHHLLGNDDTRTLPTLFGLYLYSNLGCHSDRTVHGSLERLLKNRLFLMGLTVGYSFLDGLG